MNFPPDAELLIEALKSTSECQDIQFVALDFPDKNLRFIRDEILDILPTIQTVGYRYKKWQDLDSAQHD